MTRHKLSHLAWGQGAGSHTGGRQEQQDRWGLFQSHDLQGLLAIIADGMGGHQDGALGAQVVIDTARHFTLNPPQLLQSDPLAALGGLCQEMHKAVNQHSETARSTLVMVWLVSAHAYWLNVGDSRLYHFRNGHRLMRTRDHSAVQLLMDLGEINEAQMATHPAQNRLYRCLGGEESPKADQGDFTVHPGDLLALCSDGVWEHVPETELWTATQSHGPVDAAHLLAEEAARRGGATADNTTLILLQAGSEVSNGVNSETVVLPWLHRLSTGFAALFNRAPR